MILVVRRATALVCLLSLLLTTAMAGVNSWTTKGPPGGYFNFIVASSTDSNVIYAAYIQSLHKSVDGGATWQTIREVDSPITGLAVDPANGNRVYLAIGDQGVLRSDDGGFLFNLIAPAGAAGVTGVAVAGTNVYYSSNSDFYRSANRGVSFSATSPPPQMLTRILVDNAAADSIFGFNSTYDFRGAHLIRSLDGGVSWTQIALDTTTIIQVYAATMLSPTVLAAATSGGIYVTRDAGTTWQRALIGACYAIAADLNSAGYLYATCMGFGGEGMLLRSTDFGATFVTASTTPLGVGKGIVIGGQGIGQSIGQSTASIVVASDLGVLRSTNLGGSWVEASPGPVASSPSIVTTSTAPNARVYAYSDGQEEALYSTLNDTPWLRLNMKGARATNFGGYFGAKSLAIKPDDGNTVYLISRVGNMARSADGGATWSRIGNAALGFPFEALAIDPSSSSIMYANVVAFSTTSAPPTGLYRSADGGMTWAPYATNLPTNFSENKLVIDPSDASRMFLGSAYSFVSRDAIGLYRSIDGGVTWNKIFSGQEVRDVKINPRDSNRVYAATLNGLQVSNDAGATFSSNSEFMRITRGQQASAIAIDPLQSSTLYVFGFYPGLYPVSQTRSSYILRSVDSGQTFEVLRSENATPLWVVTQGVLDPVTPGLLYARTSMHGIATFQVAPDLNIRISGHSGSRSIGVQSSFAVRADNLGPYAATNVQLRVTLPSGLSNVSATTDRGSCVVASAILTCDASTLRNGEAINVNIFYTPDTAMLHSVTATVSGREADPASSNNVAQASVFVGEVADLSVSVTPSVSTVTNGDNVNYSVRIDNNGPSDATASAMTLTTENSLLLGAAPSGCSINANILSCNVGGLIAGGMRAYIVPIITKTPGLATVTASVIPAATALDSTSSNNMATATVNVLPSGDLSVAISDSADPTNVSTNFEYRAVVRNVGPDSMPNVTAALINTGTTIGVSSTKGFCANGPGGITCNLGALAANETATITVVSASSSAGSISLQATVTSDGTDRAATNNSAQEFTTVGAPAATKSGGGGTMNDRDLALLLCLFVLSLNVKRCRYRSFVRA